MDVGDWLRRLGLERYEQAFRDNEIDPDLLPTLTADDLKDLGVALVGHRRRLVDAIAQLTAASPGSDAASDARRPSAEPPGAEPGLDQAGGPPSRSEAERRQLTVMFVDLAGSTERAGLDESVRIGARRLEAFHLGLTADVRSRAGQHEAAEATFGDAFTALGSSADMPFAADLHRLRAFALLRPRRYRRTKPSSICSAPWRSPASRERGRWSCAPRVIWPSSGPNRMNARKRTTSSRRSTAGSPKALTPLISMTARALPDQLR